MHYNVVFNRKEIGRKGEEEMRTLSMDQWSRRAQYAFFAAMSDPFYTLTFPVEIGPLLAYTRAKRCSFYRSMIWCVTKAMEEVQAFRWKDRGGSIVLHDTLIPSFTDLYPGSDAFHITTLEAGDDMEAFCRRAVQASAAQRTFLPSTPWPEDQLIYFSCLPWFPVTALKNERNLDPCDSVPRVAWGRYEPHSQGVRLLLSLELNHRLVDGVHVGQFYQALGRQIARWEGCV